MVIFLFPKMAAAVILDIQIFKILTVGTVSRVEISQIAAKIWRFFDSSRWRLPPSKYFKILKYEGREGSRWLKCIIVPNFVAIGQTVRL